MSSALDTSNLTPLLDLFESLAELTLFVTRSRQNCKMLLEVDELIRKENRTDEEIGKIASAYALACINHADNIRSIHRMARTIQDENHIYPPANQLDAAADADGKWRIFDDLFRHLLQEAKADFARVRRMEHLLDPVLAKRVMDEWAPRLDWDMDYY